MAASGYSSYSWLWQSSLTVPKGLPYFIFSKATK